MYDLSVIIVSYNVKYFLEQCLHSVRKSIENCRKAHPGFQAEVFVVDNCSTDSTVSLVRRNFPWVKLIANSSNAGFSVANNQAIRQAKGKYILLLNPDTIVEESTFEKCFAFMESHPEAGALGVKMVDGKGNFLPESKRGLPTPAVAFYKMAGLSSLFPKSKRFNRYHLGFIDENTTAEVEILSGAFMFIRKEALDKAGLLDEDFFMYGEDIDLSYRILLAGYKNYYYPGTRIIHFKGESTKKGSFDYIRRFYSAMALFAGKHFSRKQARWFSWLITLAIYLQAAGVFLKTWLKRLALPVADFFIIYGGMYVIKEFWERKVKDAPEYYPPEYMLYVVPAYILIWLVALYFNGGYDRPYQLTRTIRGIILGSLFIILIYAFLPESLRYSRAMLLLGTGWAVAGLSSIRMLLNWWQTGRIYGNQHADRRFVIVGSPDEARRTLTLLHQTGIPKNFIGFVFLERQQEEGADVLGTIDELGSIVHLYQIDEVLFCSKDIPAADIIHWMTTLGPEFDYYVIPEKGLAIIGSTSKNKAGELFAIDISLAINQPANIRAKRFLDMLTCALLLFLFPFAPLVYHPVKPFYANWWAVLKGRKSWVGYIPAPASPWDLPALKPGVLTPADLHNISTVDSFLASRLNLMYARDYTPWKDIEIIRKGWKYLNRE